MSVLLLEPFYGGSHKQLIDLLSEDLGVCRLVTLPPNKWHWRARTAALWLAERIEPSDHYRVLMASGTLNLAELLGLRQDLVPLRKVLYMHENQLAYPVQREQLRDYQYGYNQVMSCLAADVVLFNSHFNRDSFLAAVEPFLNRVPGAGRLGPLRPRLEAKARVLSFPVKVPPLFPALYRDPTSPLHVVWPHRWEHDKGPEEFVQVLLELHCLGMAFHVSFLGQEFEKLPPSLLGVREELGGHIRRWGPLPDRDEYLALLRNADVVVSTALHEFYGVAMLEASLLGCYPLCPNRLVYPEIYPQSWPTTKDSPLQFARNVRSGVVRSLNVGSGITCCLYNTSRQLFKRLRSFCRKPEVARRTAPKFELYIVQLDRSRFTWESLRPFYRELLLPPGETS